MSLGGKNKVQLKLVKMESSEFQSPSESGFRGKLGLDRSGSSSRVLKAGDLNQSQSTFRVSPYVSKYVGVPVDSSPQESIESLKQNLQSLRQLHSRLRFMLQELEEFTQK